MFEKKKEGDPETPRTVTDPAESLSTPPLRPFTRKGTHIPPRAPQVPAFKSDIPRRSVDVPVGQKRAQDSKEPKKLTVGRDICLSGDITSCDKLVVEGCVEASLTDARAIEVAETGVFKGDAEVDEADINGRFIGQLTVRDRLVVRASGLITGTVRYGRLVVEDGGAISGTLALLDDGEAAEAPTEQPAGDTDGQRPALPFGER